MLALVSSMAPGLAFADAVLAAVEEEAPAPMPFQLPAATTSAEFQTPGLPSFSLLLMLLAAAMVAGTLAVLFHSLSRPQHRNHAPAHSQRW